MAEDNIQKKLVKVQSKLKAPKNQYNSFGKYKYRNCEDILEAVKPLLEKENLLLTITDAIETNEGRTYVKASASITDGTDTVTVCAYAREPESKKGMDESQVTGASSSYARKYALNGLFLIDDQKDADNFDNASNGKSKPQTKAQPKKSNQTQAKAEQPQDAKDITLRQAISATSCAMGAGVKASGLRDYVISSFPGENDEANKFSEHFLSDKLKTLNADQLNRYITHCNTLINDLKTINTKGD